MTHQQRVAFEAQGYLTMDIPERDLDHLKLAFDRAEDCLDDLPNQNDAFIYLAEHPHIFPIVHAILSDEIQLRYLEGLVCPPNGSGKGWHRIVAGLLGVDHALSTLCVQVFIHLDDEPEGGACLMVVPGSHRFKSDLPFPDVTHIVDMPHAVTLPAKAGTVTVLHGNLWQARTQNQSDRTQRLLNLAYVHCWMRQALPQLSAHAIDVIRASANLCQLFDLRDVTLAGGYWAGQLEGHPSETGLPKRQFSPLKVVGKGAVPNK